MGWIQNKITPTLVITGRADFNKYVSIESLEYGEEDGSGDAAFTIILKEYITISYSETKKKNGAVRDAQLHYTTFPSWDYSALKVSLPFSSFPTWRTFLSFSPSCRISSEIGSSISFWTVLFSGRAPYSTAVPSAMMTF